MKTQTTMKTKTINCLLFQIQIMNDGEFEMFSIEFGPGWGAL